MTRMSAGEQLRTLRPYQREAFGAVLRSVMAGRGESFSIEIARQGGKNELSARLELVLLLLNRQRPLTSIKTAPTFRPQLKMSMDRLWARVGDAGLATLASKEDGNAIRLGRARQLFLSAEAGASVVGHTADLLLEVDEAQDVDPDKFEKDFQPMTSAGAATTVFYGTAWDDDGLLERVRQAHLAQERRDGVRRHFEYDWQAVAACNPSYGRAVRQTRERLGAEHPLFLSQYCLRALPGAGRLLSPAQLTLLRGAHPSLAAPLPGETYVAGLDAGGEAADARRDEAGHDATVLTIGRVVPGETGGAGALEVVAHYAWQGAGHGAVQSSVIALLRQWRVARVVVDATGIGEPLASSLRRAPGISQVEALKLTAESKSKLGYALLAAVNGGRVRLYAGTDAESRECWRQLELCRARYRPNQQIAFYVDERDGHDDYVISLALALAAAGETTPRVARGRTGAFETV